MFVFLLMKNNEESKPSMKETKSLINYEGNSSPHVGLIWFLVKVMVSICLKKYINMELKSEIILIMLHAHVLESSHILLIKYPKNTNIFGY